MHNPLINNNVKLRNHEAHVKFISAWSQADGADKIIYFIPEGFIIEDGLIITDISSLRDCTVRD